MNVISLFSGCGGLDLGFERAGFNIPVANIDFFSCSESQITAATTLTVFIYSLFKSITG